MTSRNHFQSHLPQTERLGVRAWNLFIIIAGPSGELVKDRYPLAPNQIKQKPGVVPEDVLNEIEQEVNNLGPPTQYK